jgi:hypothetical protein
VACAGQPLPSQRPIRFGFGGGLSVPTSDARDAFENGVNGQAYLLVNTGFLPPFRINLGYAKFDYKEAILGATGESQSLSGVAPFSFDLFRAGPVRPYIVAGLGAFNVKDVLASSATGDNETSSTHFGIDGGAGLALRIGPLEGFIEGRIQNVYTNEGVIDTRSIRAVPITFGFLF